MVIQFPTKNVERKRESDKLKVKSAKLTRILAKLRANVRVKDISTILSDGDLLWLANRGLCDYANGELTAEGRLVVGVGSGEVVQLV